MLVKEQIKTSSSDMAVLVESFAEKKQRHFFMVKDRKNRFPDTPLWADGCRCISRCAARLKHNIPNINRTTTYQG